MAKIKLTKGYEAEVDDEDYARLSEDKWQALVSKWQVRATCCRGKYRVYMHHAVLGISGEDLRRQNKEVDHEDGDPLNNRKNNLIIKDHKGNMQNTTRHKERKGYCFNARAGLWSVYIDEPDKPRKYYGYTKTKEEAIKRVEAIRNGSYY